MQGVDDSPVVSRTLQLVATTLLTQPSSTSSRLLATMMHLTIEGCTSLAGATQLRLRLGMPTPRQVEASWRRGGGWPMTDSSSVRTNTRGAAARCAAAAASDNNAHLIYMIYNTSRGYSCRE